MTVNDPTRDAKYLTMIGAPADLSEHRRKAIIEAIDRASSVEEVTIQARLATDGSYPGAELLRQQNYTFAEVLFAEKVGRARRAGYWNIRIVYTIEDE